MYFYWIRCGAVRLGWVVDGRKTLSLLFPDRQRAAARLASRGGVGELDQDRGPWNGILPAP